MDRLQGMEAFVRVVELGSFAGAADALGLSRAMVSKHVGALEARLGVRLLQRTTRRLSLTEIGRSYFERARDVLQQIAEAEDAAAALQSAPRGTLRLNAPVSFGVQHLAPALAAFQTQYPDLHVDLTLSDRFVDIVEEGVDLAIRIGRLQDSALIARRLAPCRIVIAAAPAYLAAHGTPAHPHDLAGHNCLGYAYATREGEWFFHGGDGRPVTVKVRGNLVTNNGDALLAAGLAGQGIIRVPTFMVGDTPIDGALRIVLPDWRAYDLTIHAVYPVNRHLAAKVRVFVDFLADRFRGEPPWDARLMGALGPGVAAFAPAPAEPPPMPAASD